MARIYSVAMDSERADIPKHPLDACLSQLHLFPITKFTVLA